MRPLEIILIILIILFVGGIVAWQVVKHVRKKHGKSTGPSCGCGCSGCAASANCPSANASKYYSDDPDDVMPEINVQSEVTCDFSDVVAKMNGNTETADTQNETAAAVAQETASKGDPESSAETPAAEIKPAAKSGSSAKKSTSSASAKRSASAVKTAAGNKASSTTAKKSAAKKSATGKPKKM